jgi:hypothetical protein
MVARPACQPARATKVCVTTTLDKIARAAVGVGISFAARGETLDVDAFARIAAEIERGAPQLATSGRSRRRRSASPRRRTFEELGTFRTVKRCHIHRPRGRS